MMRRTLENERAMNHILRLVASEDDLENILQRSLDILLSISWLALLPKGGVFLTDETTQELALVANKDLGPQISSLCARVRFGHCLCGRAADSRSIQFADCIDERHEIRFEGIQPHGHYSVPILQGRDVLGVIVLYLPHGHNAREDEEEFLKNVADILSIVVYHRQLECRLARANDMLQELATVDELTGLYNRRHFLERLEGRVREAERTSRPLSTIMIDVDHFKRINDEFGHAAGDAVLRVVGSTLATNVRRYDLAARHGGDEFIVYLPNTDLDVARTVAERIRRAIAAGSCDVGGGHIASVTVSLGVASIRGGEDRDSLIKRADEALYEAKVSGRNRTRLAEG